MDAIPSTSGSRPTDKLRWTVPNGAGAARRRGWIHEELWIGPLPTRSQEKATTILLCDDTHLADKPEKEPEREGQRGKVTAMRRRVAGGEERRNIGAIALLSRQFGIILDDHDSNEKLVLD